MHRFSVPIVLLTLAVAFRATAEMPFLRTTAEANAFLRECVVRQAPCELTGTVLDTKIIRSSHTQVAILEDATGRTCINPKSPVHLHPGDVVTVRGFALTEPSLEHAIDITNATVRGQRELRRKALPLSALDETRDDLLPITTEGLVVDVFRDEIDSDNVFLLLKDRGTILPVSAFNLSATTGLLGSKVRIDGIYYRTSSGSRKFSGPFIQSASVTVVAPPPSDPFAVPELENVIYLTPTEVAEMDSRKVTGTVLAVWGGDKLMVRDTYGRIVNARVAPGVALPACRQQIVLAGWPETDLFRLNLANAHWKRTGESAAPEESPDPLSIAEIACDEANRPAFNASAHGRLVRLTGRLLSLPQPDRPDQRLYLETEGHRIPVELGEGMSVPDDVVIGCMLALTGRLLLDVETGRRFQTLPRPNGLVLVLRSVQDIEILARPPWWTPHRLLAVIIALFLVIIAAFGWNRILRRLVERRGRELYRAEIDRASSELKVGERTRLAVELHDSLSQNLTGIALAVNAGEYELAKKSLKSCRDELKNCLWDLRNNSLEEKDLNEAIRKTLAPHIGGAKLTVRFNLPRRQLTDKTTHAILRILRELAVNAVRHGHAGEIRVAGSVEEHRILFSLRDNGCGFDPEHAPGMDEGHFGLQGIRERIDNMGGEIRIESVLAKGTKVTIWFNSKC